jgi:hypothetical protein
MEQTPQQNDSPKGEPDSELKKENQAKEAGKKIVFQMEDTDSGLENLPAEASDLMKNILSADVFMKTSSAANEKTRSDSMTPEETMAKAPKMDQQAQDLLRRMVMQEKLSETPPPAAKPETVSQDLPAKAPPPAPPPPPPRSPAPPPPPKMTEKNEFAIDERGAIFGLQINKAKRKDIIEVMKSKSKVNNSSSDHSTLKYEDVGINFYLESGILQEITFSYPFEGATVKGLQIFDTINRAIELYGQPKMRTPGGAIWENMALFLKDDTVTTIRIRSN